MQRLVFLARGYVPFQCDNTGRSSVSGVMSIIDPYQRLLEEGVAEGQYCS